MRLLPLALLLTGCVNTTTLAASHDALQKEVNDAMTRQKCAPVDLAIAQSQLHFAEIELAEGSPRRAVGHIGIAREHVKAANQCAAGTGAGVLDPTEMAGAEMMSSVASPVETSKAPTAPTTKAPTTAAVAKTTKDDRDRDGVADDDDVCVDDAEDLDGFKDSDGCPELDNDNDGILDAGDKCRDAAEDKDGFADTDGCPETDNDADGIPDAADACPTQAGQAALKGCPSQDADNDGVLDSKDECPTIPESPNGWLDDDGCPDSAPIVPPTAPTPASTASGSLATLTGDQITISKTVEFAAGKATLSTSSYAVLDSVVAVMKANPTIKIEIGGHTDNQGDDAKNQTLSKDRADAVFEYLLSKGVEARRMRTTGYGETQPIDTNMTETGRAKNRRIEFVVLK